ncbi:MAG TPA: HlyD family efflux transporter periplasmic adaptor subunit [Rhodanobacter sp.]|nr:HlyD family efflux transporter periplasmic adaptor subunit [Rhodanobacter sp.]
MIRRLETLAWLLLLTLPVQATVFTGEVRVIGAQDIFTPPSMSSPVVLRYYVADGAHVDKGQVLLRIDAGSAETELRSLQAKIDQTAAKNAKEIGSLELKRVDAELALADAQAQRDTAAVDAVIPKALISALNYDRHQGEMERTGKALALKKQEVAQAVAAVARRRQDGALELRKQQLSLGFYQDQVAGAVVRAERAGVVVHGFDNVTGNGGRYEEGSSSWPGIKVGEVVGAGSGFTVRGWVLSPDRHGLHTGQSVRLHFDALPGKGITGIIDAIAGAPAARTEWGDGRYYAVDIRLPATMTLPLLPGMSVRLDTELADPGGHAAAPESSSEAPVQIDGEVYAQSSLAISPPSVEGLWQMTVTQMAGDGAQVKRGDMVAVFDASTVVKNLTAKQGELTEKQRTQEQLRLDLADRVRDAALATAKAQAEMDKARRKAAQPKEYMAGVDYQKLVIARTKAERVLVLTRQREQIGREERAAEQHMADADVSELDAEVKTLKAGLASLTVTAPRDGIVLHQDNWSGGKIDTGSQIWLGQSVAQMPDMSTLAVRAALPERDLRRVHVKQPVEVVLAGGGDRRIGGRIAEVGSTVHSKSRVEPVPVVDLVVQLDPVKLKLKPGQSVQVIIPVAPETSR